MAREEARIANTIPMPTLARRPSTMSSFFPVDIPHNSKVEAAIRRHNHFSCWKMRFRSWVTTCSDVPSEAMLWIKEVEMVDSLDVLKSLRSIAGNNFPNFEVLDARIASALNKIIQNFHFKKEVSLEEQKAQKV